MARVIQADELADIIGQLARRISDLETAARRSQFAAVGVDPANPRQGDTWVRTDTNVARIWLPNGTAKTFTLT